MGLDIGVVNIEYLQRPEQPIYGFLLDLMGDPDVGTDMDLLDGGSPWEVGEGGNVFYEFERGELMRRADGWAVKQQIDASDRTKLLQWVDNMPWRGGFITLYLNI